MIMWQSSNDNFWSTADLLFINKHTNKHIWIWLSCDLHEISIKLSSYVHIVIFSWLSEYPLMIICWSSHNHLMIILLSSKDHLKKKRGLIIIRIVPAFDYHIIMWWSFNDHNWPIVDLLLIKNKQTNKVKYEDVVIITLLSCNYNNIII